MGLGNDNTSYKNISHATFGYFYSTGKQNHLSAEFKFYQLHVRQKYYSFLSITDSVSFYHTLVSEQFYLHIQPLRLMDGG